MDPIRSDDLKNIAHEIQRLIDDEESGVLVLVTGSSGSSPGKVGAKMLVLADGRIHGTVGGGVVEARVMADALNALEDGRGPRSEQYDLAELGMTCGGEMAVYIEPLQAPRRVIVFGGGHVGTAVARLLTVLGCQVTVVDEREEWANRERLPDIQTIVNQPFAEYLGSHPVGGKDHVVIVTRGHQQDQLVLEETAERAPAYLGMIGSRRKAKRALDLLRDKGVSEELVSAVRTPLGIDIGAVTPEEIAVSLAGELIHLWRRGSLPESPRAVPMKKTGVKVKKAKARPAQPPVAKPATRPPVPKKASPEDAAGAAPLDEGAAVTQVKTAPAKIIEPPAAQDGAAAKDEE